MGSDKPGSYCPRCLGHGPWDVVSAPLDGVGVDVLYGLCVNCEVAVQLGEWLTFSQALEERGRRQAKEVRSNGLRALSEGRAAVGALRAALEAVRREGRDVVGPAAGEAPAKLAVVLAPGAAPKKTRPV